MAPAKPRSPPPSSSSLVDDSLARKPKKKKKKPQQGLTLNNAPPAKYVAPEPKQKPSDLARVSVKPGTKSLPQVPDLARIGSGSARQLAVSPDGGYSTGYYRVLLESKPVETLCRALSLQYRHVAQLHRLFQSEDNCSTGMITIDEFFHAIRDERRLVTLGMFPYVGLPPKIRQLNFDQFVLCVVTFAALSRKELLHYAFSLFDKDDSGIMDMQELRAFCGNLKHTNGFYFQKNVEVAQQKLAEKDHRAPGAHRHAAGADGLVDFEDLHDGSEHFQIAFYPLVQFQHRIQSAALGEAFWTDVVYKKKQIERAVHYMRLHDGHLPPVSICARIAAMAKYSAFLLTGGGTTTVFSGGPIAIRQAAITKFAEETRLRREEEEEKKLKKEQEMLQRLAEEQAATDTGTSTCSIPDRSGAIGIDAAVVTVSKSEEVDAVSLSPQKKKKKHAKKAVVVAAD